MRYKLYWWTSFDIFLGLFICNPWGYSRTAWLINFLFMPSVCSNVVFDSDALPAAWQIVLHSLWCHYMPPNKYNTRNSITVASHDCHGISNHRQLVWQVVQHNSTWNIITPHYCVFMRVNQRWPMLVILNVINAQPKSLRTMHHSHP